MQKSNAPAGLICEQEALAGRKKHWCGLQGYILGVFTRYKLCGSLLVPAMMSSTARTRARGVAPSVGDSRARRLGLFRAGLRDGEAESGGLFGAGRILSLLGDVRRALHGSHVLVGGVLGGLGSRLLGRGRGFVDDVFVGGLASSRDDGVGGLVLVGLGVGGLLDLLAGGGVRGGGVLLGGVGGVAFNSWCCAHILDDLRSRIGLLWLSGRLGRVDRLVGGGWDGAGVLVSSRGSGRGRVGGDGLIDIGAGGKDEKAA